MFFITTVFKKHKNNQKNMVLKKKAQIETETSVAGFSIGRSRLGGLWGRHHGRAKTPATFCRRSRGDYRNRACRRNRGDRRSRDDHRNRACHRTHGDRDHRNPGGRRISDQKSYKKLK